MMPNPCKICKTDKYLKPKWNTETSQRWVHCDKCGSVSTPSHTKEHPLINWNKENPKPVSCETPEEPSCLS